MARIGYDVLQIDLLGCGDSSGDFAEARWQDWEDDVHLAHRWLRARSDAPVCLWGLRAGCLLAASAACLLAASAAVKLKDTTNFIFWQPVVSGKQHWQQFMRLKMASVLAAGQAKAVSDQLRQQLSTGQAVEIAGYTLAPALVESLEAAELKPPGAIGGRTPRALLADGLHGWSCRLARVPHSLRCPRNASDIGKLPPTSWMPGW